MRKLLTSLSVSIALSSAGTLCAQAPNPVSYEKDVPISTGHRNPTPADHIYQRASLEARERLARIESRHWSGISAQRPTFSFCTPVPSTDLLLVAPPINPVPYRCWY